MDRRGEWVEIPRGRIYVRQVDFWDGAQLARGGPWRLDQPAATLPHLDALLRLTCYQGEGPQDQRTFPLGCDPPTALLTSRDIAVLTQALARVHEDGYWQGEEGSS